MSAIQQKNGQQKARENVSQFKAWIQEREVCKDWGSYVRGVKLNRTEIAKECLFAMSVLRQNPEVKNILSQLENNLRQRNILPIEVMKKSTQELPEHDTQRLKNKMDTSRLNRLEQENTALQAEVKHLKSILERYKLMDEILSESGRFIR